MKLNFACGATRWPGFENSDINGEPGVTHIDLEDRPLPYPDDSAELIMHSHGLLMTKDGQTPSHPDLPALLAEWHRILEPGGWLRLDDNPFRFYDDTEHLGSEGAGFPVEQRMKRSRLREMLYEAGFRVVWEIDPDRTHIPTDDQTREAIVGNHLAHPSFAIEARK